MTQRKPSSTGAGSKTSGSVKPSKSRSTTATTTTAAAAAAPKPKHAAGKVSTASTSTKAGETVKKVASAAISKPASKTKSKTTATAAAAAAAAATTAAAASRSPTRSATKARATHDAPKDRSRASSSSSAAPPTQAIRKPSAATKTVAATSKQQAPKPAKSATRTLSAARSAARRQPADSDDDDIGSDSIPRVEAALSTSAARDRGLRILNDGAPVSQHDRVAIADLETHTTPITRVLVAPSRFKRWVPIETSLQGRVIDALRTAAPAASLPTQRASETGINIESIIMTLRSKAELVLKSIVAPRADTVLRLPPGRQLQFKESMLQAVDELADSAKALDRAFSGAESESSDAERRIDDLRRQIAAIPAQMAAPAYQAKLHPLLKTPIGEASLVPDQAAIAASMVDDELSLFPSRSTSRKAAEARRQFVAELCESDKNGRIERPASFKKLAVDSTLRQFVQPMDTSSP
ncbi:hypothetical protein CAOG_08924 [Capsaspora owczarzaki ATCC 30864]|uniref:Uncharacterized protein n=1 Tax=Capsaspora owczarzaki (strain ATCC 30864) TaxID=595528 RepID=A0A0D2WUB7_CAPO3|nr:hypothetical protein CAOG_08924 [Capsaspora owczarzaki ATCC 30864]KJE95488.1 hypothetical protein CAOG_008924 [Capsaspora owczarzaki ATCC 30864]|eukprot:XP_011270595.1 hypothetical protein CAOG_08924 [Capsaspora owczarzaki ATCC 30864]